MSEKEIKESVFRTFEEYNAIKGDISKSNAWVDKYYTPDSITHAPMSGDMNFEQIKQYHAVEASALNPSYALKQVIVEGNMVASQFTLNVTHKGSFMGIPATGNTFQTEGVMVFKVNGNKIQELWFYMDTLGFMRQLGATPSPGAAAARK